jgi:ABC-2 type transport system ATP-binding protein
MISLREVSRQFGALRAVDRLSLEIPQGEIFGLVGPDGAGKTTTLRMIAGLLDATGGGIAVNGVDVAKHPDEVKDTIGYMAQRFGLYGDLSVDENLGFYADLFGVEDAQREELASKLLEMVRMTPFRDRAAAKLSGGMKQKLALACTLLHKPRVLLLDEPTNGVDPLSRRDFWAILTQLAAEGMTVFVSTAYLDEAERCGRVALMDHGRILRCDSPEALKASLAPRAFVAGQMEREKRLRLNAAPGVIAAEPAGAALHVFLESADARGEVEQAAGVELTPLDPSLEDVFIAEIRAAQRGTAPHAA